MWTTVRRVRTVAGRYDVLLAVSGLWFAVQFLRYLYPPLFPTFQAEFGVDLGGSFRGRAADIVRSLVAVLAALRRQDAAFELERSDAEREVATVPLQSTTGRSTPTCANVYATSANPSPGATTIALLVVECEPPTPSSCIRVGASEQSG
jgi:hypothetical protein